MEFLLSLAHRSLNALPATLNAVERAGAEPGGGPDEIMTSLSRGVRPFSDLKRSQS
jgi:hypothetical protein